jgi:hypothetical protein
LFVVEGQVCYTQLLLLIGAPFCRNIFVAAGVRWWAYGEAELCFLFLRCVICWKACAGVGWGCA